MSFEGSESININLHLTSRPLDLEIALPKLNSSFADYRYDDCTRDAPDMTRGISVVRILLKAFSASLAALLPSQQLAEFIHPAL